MIDQYKRIDSELTAISEDLKEIKENMFTMKENFGKIIKEMKFFARKDQLKILEKYINMWNPFNFVTEEEVLELIKKNKAKPKNERKRKKR